MATLWNTTENNYINTMHKISLRLIVIALLVTGLAGASRFALAQAQPTDPNATPPKSEPPAPAPKKKTNPDGETKSHGIPFHGKLQAVDKVEKTLTIKGKEKDRIFLVTSHTKLSRDGKPATLADAVVGEEIAGFAREASAGKYEALSIRFGARAPGQTKPKKPKDDTTPAQTPQ